MVVTHNGSQPSVAAARGEALAWCAGDMGMSHIAIQKAQDGKRIE